MQQRHTSLSAQFYDNYWLMGYAGGDQSSLTDSFGISILSFHNAELKIENNQEIDLDFDGSGNALSDYEGSLILYSDNREIRNIEDELIENGLFEQNGSSERLLPQSAIFLPFDFMDLVHYVQMTYTDNSPQVGQNFSSSLINIQEESRIFRHLENIVPDSLTTGEVIACRHANGQDWWILLAASDKSLIYSILLSPNKAILVDSIQVIFNLEDGLGQASFSPNGSHYIRYNSVIVGQDDYLDIFDFDRCTGKVSNHKHTTLGGNAGPGGVAVSPSSQFLYVSHTNYIYQYDLWAEDIFATKDTVAIYDGYQENNFFRTQFYLAQLAPNGKIYLNSPSGVRTLHVIEAPDKKGLACNVRQHSIPLPNFNSFALANHPNYRLGPIDNSSADSLGIDNFPRAYYRIDRDSTDTLSFHFQDLSFYEPTSWSWTFGDGSSSIERHPDHTYPRPGIYEVCLTVTNELGADTSCRTIELGTVGTAERNAIKLTTFPNPVQDVMVLDLGDYYPVNGQFKFYDALGREVLHDQVLYQQKSFDLSFLAPGNYYYRFVDQGKVVGKGKVIIMGN